MVLYTLTSAGLNLDLSRAFQPNTIFVLLQERLMAAPYSTDNLCSRNTEVPRDSSHVAANYHREK
jgi:hypothetical protein